MSGKENNVRDIDHEIEQSMKPMRSRAGLGAVFATTVGVIAITGLGAVMKQNAENHADTSDCLRDALIHKGSTHKALSDEGLTCYDDNGQELGRLFIESASFSFKGKSSLTLDYMIEYHSDASTQEAAKSHVTLREGDSIFDKVSHNIVNYTPQ